MEEKMRSRLIQRAGWALLGLIFGPAIFAQEGKFVPQTVGETEPPQAGDPACPGTGSCCVGHGGPGCNNMTCCNLVCASDFLCCFAWSSDCAILADQICGSTCAGSCPGIGDCCAAHTGGGCNEPTCCDLVCLEMPVCCESGWSAGCAELAGKICVECEAPPDYVCPQPGNCCEQRFFGGGCERAGCCETICSVDPLCCNDVWDSICAREARENCLNVCDCESFGNFDSDPAINLRDMAGFLNCFSGDGSAPVAPACSCADYDGDGDADVADFAQLALFLDPVRD